jgi:FtsH-binding integral membrane protein
MLSAGLWGLIGVGLIQFFLPFSQTADLVVAGFGVLVFSGYVVFDTSVGFLRLLVKTRWTNQSALAGTTS